jgi:hypothetical protein
MAMANQFCFIVGRGGSLFALGNDNSHVFSVDIRGGGAVVMMLALLH